MSIVIVGAGPNLGLAISRRFGSEGLPVGLVSRDKAKLDGLVEQLKADGIQASGEAADIREPDALARAIGALADRLGAVEVLEYSPLPAPEFMKPILKPPPRTSAGRSSSASSGPSPRSKPCSARCARPVAARSSSPRAPLHIPQP